MGRFVTHPEMESYLRHLNEKNNNVQRSISSRTITFTNALTVAQIQAMIDEVPRHVPYGQTLEFHFADGVYSLTTSIVFSGFYGGGIIIISGNKTETTALHTTQAVYLDVSSYDAHAVIITACAVQHIIVEFLKVRSKTSAAAYDPIRIQYNNCLVSITASYVLGTGASYGDGVRGYYSSRVYVGATYCSTIQGGFAVEGGTEMISDGNDDTGTAPQYGLLATGAVIRKNGTQPSGSIASEQTYNGGQIL